MAFYTTNLIPNFLRMPTILPATLILYSSTLFASGSSSNLSEYQSAAIEDNDYKKAIAIQLDMVNLASSESQKACLQKLAYLFLKDQDQERAFATFLKILDLQIAGSPTPEPSYDTNLYKKTFALYLDPKAQSPKITADNIIKLLDPILSGINEKADQPLLHYFLAIANANLGKYEEFFKHFSLAFQYYPTHYLAYKTKAVLHIKLLERTRVDEERSEQRLLISKNLLQALEREPLDTTIYKLLISFSPKEKKREQVQLCLNKIVNGNIMIPRAELMFYVTEAVDLQDLVLAQRFIARAKDWYPASRIVTAAQNYLDAHK